jgi:membrane-associated phospholipid phosphatase
VTAVASLVAAGMLFSMPTTTELVEEPGDLADGGTGLSQSPVAQQSDAGVNPLAPETDALHADAATVAKVVDVWPRELPQAGAWDIAATAALGVGSLVLQVTYTAPATANWTGGVLFDDWVRRVLRLSSPSARAAASTTSDVLLFTLITVPFIDAWLGAGVGHGRPDIAWKLTIIDAEALLATSFISLGAQHLVARARPFTTLCVHQPNAGECTDGSSQYTSFPSGHTSIAFTVALLECVNHAHLDTDRSGWNGAACPVTLIAAGVTGLLRIASDRHYASDVIVGGLLGAGIGYLVPTLHFAVVSKDSTTAIIPLMGPSYAGLALSGGF